MANLFEKSEGTRADLKNLLGLALMKSQANLYLAQLMIWIFNTTDSRSVLKKSYDELAATPWGLCCHRNQAYATVQKAKRLGLLKVTPTYGGPGIQAANEYAIDWPGVRRVVGLKSIIGQPDGYHTTCDPPHTPCDPGHTTCDPPHTTCEHTKEYTSSHLLAPLDTPTSSGGAAGANLVLVRTARSKRTTGSVLADSVRPDQVLAWRAIERRLLELGVYVDLSEDLLAKAAARGATPSDVTALADHFASKPGAWTAGALTIVLKRWAPGQPYDAAALWPPPSDEYVRASRRQAAERLSTTVVEEYREQRAESQRDLDAYRELDARLGPQLDALDDQAFAALVAPLDRFKRDFALRRGGRDKRMVREWCFQLLDPSPQPEET